MQIQPAVKQETAKIAVGVGVLSALMAAVYLIIGRFTYRVLLGTLLGAAFAVGNFFLMALSVQRAAARMNGVQLPLREEEEDGCEPAAQELSPQAKQARQRMQLSYTGRMLMLAGMAALAYLLPCFELIPSLIPLLFPRIVIFIQGIMMKKETPAQ